MAPTPAFHQLGASTGPRPAAIIGESIQIVVSSRTLALRRPSRRVVSPSVESLTSSILHLVDESSQGEEEAVPLKRRRIVIDGDVIENKEPTGGDPERVAAVPESGMALDAETAPLKMWRLLPWKEGAIKGS